MNKDKRIYRFIENIKNDLGTEDFVVVDHWDADLCSIGVAKKNDVAQLVYVSTYNKSSNEYYYELEFSNALEKSKSIFDTEGNVKYEVLLNIIKIHTKECKD